MRKLCGNWWEAARQPANHPASQQQVGMWLWEKFEVHTWSTCLQERRTCEHFSEHLSVFQSHSRCCFPILWMKYAFYKTLPKSHINTNSCAEGWSYFSLQGVIPLDSVPYGLLTHKGKLSNTSLCAQYHFWVFVESVLCQEGIASQMFIDIVSLSYFLWQKTKLCLQDVHAVLVLFLWSSKQIHFPLLKIHLSISGLQAIRSFPCCELSRLGEEIGEAQHISGLLKTPNSTPLFYRPFYCWSCCSHKGTWEGVNAVHRVRNLWNFLKLHPTFSW